MIPQHANPLNTVPKLKVYPTRTFRHRDKPRNSEREPYESRITQQIQDQEALEQAVLHILRTERYDYVIYPEWHGIELMKYHHRTYGYFKSTIHQTLEDALLVDDRFRSVTINEVGRVDIDAAFVDFVVHTNLGAISFRADIEVTA